MPARNSGSSRERDGHAGRPRRDRRGWMRAGPGGPEDDAIGVGRWPPGARSGQRDSRRNTRRPVRTECGAHALTNYGRRPGASAGTRSPGGGHRCAGAATSGTRPAGGARPVPARRARGRTGSRSRTRPCPSTRPPAGSRVCAVEPRVCAAEPGRPPARAGKPKAALGRPVLPVAAMPGPSGGLTSHAGRGSTRSAGAVFSGRPWSRAWAGLWHGGHRSSAGAGMGWSWMARPLQVLTAPVP